MERLLQWRWGPAEVVAAVGNFVAAWAAVEVIAVVAPLHEGASEMRFESSCC